MTDAPARWAVRTTPDRGARPRSGSLYCARPGAFSKSPRIGSPWATSPAVASRCGSLACRPRSPQPQRVGKPLRWVSREPWGSGPDSSSERLGRRNCTKRAPTPGDLNSSTQRGKRRGAVPSSLPALTGTGHFPCSVELFSPSKWERTRRRIVLDSGGPGAGDDVSPVARVFPRDSSRRRDRESGHLEVPWKTRIAVAPMK